MHLGWNVESSRGLARTKLSPQGRVAKERNQFRPGGSIGSVVVEGDNIQLSCLYSIVLEDIETLEHLGKYLLCTGSSVEVLLHCAKLQLSSCQREAASVLVLCNAMDMQVLAEEWVKWPHGGWLGPNHQDFEKHAKHASP